MLGGRKGVGAWHVILRRRDQRRMSAPTLWLLFIKFKPYRNKPRGAFFMRKCVVDISLTEGVQLNGEIGVLFPSLIHKAKV